MLSLLPVSLSSKFLPDVIFLLLRYKNLIFSEHVNPLHVFWEGLKSGKTKVIAAFKNNSLIAFVVFYNFQKINSEKFSCYMYGASERGVARDLEILFSYLFLDLQKQGCQVLRFDTREYNMPMRNLAQRLAFRKVGVLSNTNFLNGKFRNSILYEKILN